MSQVNPFALPSEDSFLFYLHCTYMHTCSGGKDSCYNMMKCVAAGHEVVALANIQPKGKGTIIIIVCLFLIDTV